MDRGAWQATVSPWGRKESDMTEHTCSSLLKQNTSYPALDCSDHSVFSLETLIPTCTGQQGSDFY